jgi:hypothetical protein
VALNRLLVLEFDKRLTRPFYIPGFYTRTVRGSSIMVSEPEDLEFEPRPRIPLHVIISTYRSLYGGAHIAQTSDPSGGALAGTQ